MRLRQPAQGRRIERGSDRRAARQAAFAEGGLAIPPAGEARDEGGGGALRLQPISLGTDIGELSAQLAPAFGGDAGPARSFLEQTLDLLTRDPREPPWGCYLAAADAQIVGTCAFKSAPDAVGTVEIAYMTFPAHEGRGHATAMAAALVDIAAAAGASLAIAHTLPEENASTRALRRNGFIHAGEVIDPEDGLVWRWEKGLA